MHPDQVGQQETGDLGASGGVGPRKKIGEGLSGVVCRSNSSGFASVRSYAGESGVRGLCV